MGCCISLRLQRKKDDINDIIIIQGNLIKGLNMLKKEITKIKKDLEYMRV